MVEDHNVLTRWEQDWQGSPKNHLEIEEHYSTLIDNSKQGGTRVPTIFDSGKWMSQWSEDNEVSLQTRHITVIPNALDEGLSRATQILSMEWVLHKQVLKAMWAHWQGPQVNLVSTKFNLRLLVCVSPCPNSIAFAVKSILDACAYPPITIIPAVLANIELDMEQLIMVALKWPLQIWYSTLTDLLIDNYLLLPNHPCLAQQSHSFISISNRGPVSAEMRLLWNSSRVSCPDAQQKAHNTKYIVSRGANNL